MTRIRSLSSCLTQERDSAQVIALHEGQWVTVAQMRRDVCALVRLLQRYDEERFVLAFKDNYYFAVALLA